MLRKEYQEIVDTREKEALAKARIIMFQNRNENNKNICAFSGGKDSLVNYMMCVKSNINFTPIYSLTSVDPPEVYNFIIKVFNPWAELKGYPKVIINKYNKFTEKRAKGKMTGKEITMWTLLANRTIPPTRLTRYCCDELKERTGDKGDTVFTGVRWEESRKRSTQKMVNFWKDKKMVRPIVDWTEVEVWSYILKNNIPYCELYDKGWNRVGCIGCPLGSNMKKELEAYPKYKENYIRAFDKMVKYRKICYEEVKGNWKTGLDIYRWWIGETKNTKENTDMQISLFDEKVEFDKECQMF